MKYTIKVDGMHCEMCENRVKKAVMAVGVSECVASAKEGTVSVECTENELAAVKNAIYDAGFDVK